MKLLIRVLIGIVGGLALALTLMLWLDPEQVGATLGISIMNATGFATVRADIAGFFGGLGILSLLAAIRGQVAYATAALLLVTVAIAGRAINIALTEWSPSLLPPIAIEAALILLFALASRTLRET